MGARFVITASSEASACREGCGGGSICKCKQRRLCWEGCGGGAFCKHGKQRSRCMVEGCGKQPSADAPAAAAPDAAAPAAADAAAEAPKPKKKKAKKAEEPVDAAAPHAAAPKAADAAAEVPKPNKKKAKKKGKTMNAEASTFAVALDVSVPANMEQDDGADSVVAGTCLAVPHSQPYAGRMCVAALLLTGPAQTTEPIDSDDSWLRPELDITRLKTEAPVEIRRGDEW